MSDRIAELDQKLSRAQDLAIEGLISKEDLRKKSASINADKEVAEQELNTNESQKRLNKLRDDRLLLLGVYGMGLMIGFEHFSPEERHLIYRKLGLKFSARPDGTIDVEGSLGTNILPTDNEILPEALTSVRERFHRGASVISLATTTTESIINLQQTLTFLSPSHRTVRRRCYLTPHDHNRGDSPPTSSVGCYRVGRRAL